MDELPKYLQSLRHPEAFVPLVLGLSLIYLALANDESRTRFALFGLGGLLYGYFRTAHINAAEYSQWFIPGDVTDLRRFLCAGYMHNASYLGGVLAILVGWAFHIVVRVRTEDADQPAPVGEGGR